MALSVPVNSTILYLNDLRNGSLFSQIQYNLSSIAAVYPGNTADQGLNLTVLANNVASIAFNVGGFMVPSDSGYLPDSLAGTFALAETLFDPNLSRVAVTCVYPISGQYDTLSRALFYVLMIFSLVFRRHIWISVAALGTAMTYAAVSAVHLFALSSRFSFNADAESSTTSAQPFADIDFVGILPNLTASAIMLTPILLWSTTVRKNDAQSIVVWWGILIFAALVCLLVNWNSFNLDSLESFAICAKDCIPESDLESYTLPFGVYQSCGCIDFCGTLSPTAPMRKGASMVPWFDALKSKKIVDTPGYQTLFDINIVALAFIAIYGIMGLIVSRWSPDEVRNGIFRFCNSDIRLWIKVIFQGKREAHWLAKFNLTKKRDEIVPFKKKSLWKKCKYIWAKTIATLFSLTAGATAIICPAVFVSSVVANEILLQSYPVSEHSDAVGAWGTWVGAALVLIAAVINKYAGSWVRTLKVVVTTLYHFVMYSKADREELFPKKKGESVGSRFSKFGKVIISPPVHAGFSMYRGFWTLKTTILFFLKWWKDTEKESQKRGETIQKEWETALPEKPKCHCHVCKHDEGRLKENEKVTQTSDDDATHASLSSALLPGGASTPVLTSSTSSLPLKTMAMDVDEMPSSNSPTNGTNNQARPPSPPNIPLPTPRSTFARQNTDQDMV
ncbi:uncharacterized protein PAC_08085 [Phialocephala subalpina]|uniref:Uncharacterized protein n=1 Tax=Phialocephala subalpina TaxID=576137 RepID=A0A1L7WZJ5_9HELO|nr:uncharacterized protein PAC_08085 [Phialocephala subalpina]